MKLIGNLKNQVENAKSKEEAKGVIEKAGMSLTADELEMVTGGMSAPAGRQWYNSDATGYTGQIGDSCGGHIDVINYYPGALPGKH